MKKSFIALLVFAGLSLGTVYSQGTPAGDRVGDVQSTTVKDLNPQPPAAPLDAVLLFDNGPLVTQYGVGFGGMDVSELQTLISMNYYGWTAQPTLYWVADDFTVPDGGWHISGFESFAYQTNSTTASTITHLYIKIYDGPPYAGGNLIFGDGTTNHLTSTGFSGIYRPRDIDLQNNLRPLMLTYAAMDLYLDPGTYWISWALEGTLASGPFVPEITIAGETLTGNAVQYNVSTDSWASLIDVDPQGLPFRLYGDPVALPVSGWALVLGIGLILVIAVARFRKVV